MAMKYLVNQELIRSSESLSESKMRLMKIYTLTKSIDEIMNCIENEKKIETNSQLALVQKLREHLP
jgi:predicted transcriptional regulator